LTGQGDRKKESRVALGNQHYFIKTKKVLDASLKTIMSLCCGVSCEKQLKAEKEELHQ
jgi:hypothetical protein